MSETKLIPAKHADIFWNDEPGRHGAGGEEVLVVDSSPGQPVRVRETDLIHLDNSHGSMVMGWCEDDHPMHSPIGIFTRNWLVEGSKPESVRAALREFAKIEEADWARQMLAVFDWVEERRSEPSDL